MNSVQMMPGWKEVKEGGCHDIMQELRYLASETSDLVTKQPPPNTSMTYCPISSVILPLFFSTPGQRCQHLGLTAWFFTNE